MIQLVAAAPSAPNPANKEICQNTNGKWLTVVYKGSFEEPYLVSDVYCQCNEINFIKVTRLSGWTGCNSSPQFMTESEFIDALKTASSQAKSVNENMDGKYIQFVKDQIYTPKRTLILFWIGVIIIFFLITCIILKKFRKNKAR